MAMGMFASPANLYLVGHFAWELVAPQNIFQLLGFVAAVLSLLGSSVHIVRHLLYNNTKLRGCTLRILLVVPIFAVVSWLCLLLEANRYDWGVLLRCARDFYEAVALASFMQFVFAVLGGPHHVAQMLRDEGLEPVAHLGPLKLCLPSLGNSAEFVAMAILGILQFVGVMAIFSILNLVFWMLSLGPVWFGMLQVLKAMSCAVAMYFLTLFSHEVYSHLPSIGLGLKFVAIKGIVFFTFWQGFVLDFLAKSGALGHFMDWVKSKSEESGLKLDNFWDEREVKAGANDFLLCLEVLFFCVLHYFAYPAREWGPSLDDELRRRIAEENPVSSADFDLLWSRARSLGPSVQILQLSHMYAEFRELRTAACLLEPRRRLLESETSLFSAPPEGKQ